MCAASLWLKRVKPVYPPYPDKLLFALTRPQAGQVLQAGKGVHRHVQLRRPRRGGKVSVKIGCLASKRDRRLKRRCIGKIVCSLTHMHIHAVLAQAHLTPARRFFSVLVGGVFATLLILGVILDESFFLANLTPDRSVTWWLGISGVVSLACTTCSLNLMLGLSCVLLCRL